MNIFKKKKDKYQIAAEEEAARLRLLDDKKARLLSKDMDFAFLEEIIQKINEDPRLQVKITLNDGTVLDINTKSKMPKVSDLYSDNEDIVFVK